MNSSFDSLYKEYEINYRTIDLKKVVNRTKECSHVGPNSLQDTTEMLVGETSTVKFKRKNFGPSRRLSQQDC